MFCNKCGAQVEEGAKFCGVCGNTIEAAPAPEAPAYQAPAYEAPAYVSPAAAAVTMANEAELAGLAKGSLVFGILSLVFSGLLGLIFALVGKGKAKSFERLSGGPATGTAKVGKILCTVGLILSIVAFCVIGLYALILIVALAGAMGEF